MKATVFYLLGLVLAHAATLPARAAGGWATPMPDLRIEQVIENGTHAWVKVANIGTGNSAPCHLRVWHLNNGLWFVTTTVPVNGVPVGGSIWVLAQGGGIAAAFNAYKIDGLNQLVELKEVNNLVYIPYGPAG